MLKPADIEILQTLRDDNVDIQVHGDKAYFCGTGDPVPYPFLTRALSVTAIKQNDRYEEGYEFYSITPIGRQIVADPEYLNQLTIAIF